MPEHIAQTDPFKQITETVGSGHKVLPGEFVAALTPRMRAIPIYMLRQEPADWMIGGKVAHFERIEWRVIPDSATAAAALQAGEIDWDQQVQPDLVPLLRRNRDIRIGSHNPTGYNGVLRFNHLHPPFNNVAVRRAVIMGVNQVDYMASVTGGDASAYATCKSMFPCGSHYGLEVGVDVMQGDVAKAKAMLQASESVRRLHEGIQSFLSIRRMDARRMNASALWLRFSQSFASRRQRPNQPMVRSTIQRLGRTTKPLA